MVNQETKEIISVDQDKGKVHDFNMYKKTINFKINPEIELKADSGYQGIKEFHNNSETPKKSSKKNPLTKEEKQNNKRIAKERIMIEHINAIIKIFKIMCYKYRNRRKRHLLRMSLICGIYNYELVC